MICIFRVTTNKGDVWESVASGFNAAIGIACDCFKCPESAIDSVEIVRRVDPSKPEEDPPTVIVTVEGGVVQHVSAPHGTVVLVKDYDTDGCDEDGPNMRRDGLGTLYEELRF